MTAAELYEKGLALAERAEAEVDAPNWRGQATLIVRLAHAYAQLAAVRLALDLDAEVSEMNADDVTTVTISTRHPEHYELANRADGTRWIIQDGTWMAAGR